MNRRVSMFVLLPVMALAVTLLAPGFAEACRCDTSNPCSGTYCFCECDFCSDSFPPKDPCSMTVALAFKASPSELAEFEEQIKAWRGKPHLKSLAEAATELYNAVFFQDSVGYIEASEKFREAMRSLPADSRRNLSPRKQ